MRTTSRSPSSRDTLSPDDTALTKPELANPELGRTVIHDIGAIAAESASANDTRARRRDGSSSSAVVVATATAAVQRAAAELRGVQLALLGDQELVEATRNVEAAARCLYGAQVRLAGELAARGVDGLLGARSATHALTQILRITAAESKARIAAASMALGSESLTGVAIEPELPELAEAIDDGIISDVHAKVITSCTAALPQQLDSQTRKLCLNVLLDEAKHSDPNRLRRVAEHIRQICDPDGTLDGKQPFDRAELHFGQIRRDGLTPYHGLADPLTMAQMRAAIDDLSQPTPIDTNTPDPRTAPVRRAQALHEVLRRYLANSGNPVDTSLADRNMSESETEAAADSEAADSHSRPGTAQPRSTRRDNGPRNGGARPQIGITINIAELLGKPTTKHAGLDAGIGAEAARSWTWPVVKTSDPGGLQLGQFDHGAPVDRRTAQLLACDSDLIRLLIGADGAVLDVGRAVRLFTRVQRRALLARDRGCAFPGCDVPATWCEAHHITYWRNDGKTDLENGVLLCRRHHTIIHQEHWQITSATDTAIPRDMRPPDTSVRSRPWFIPPRWIDPHQQPRRNNHFFLPHIITTVMRR